MTKDKPLDSHNQQEQQDCTEESGKLLHSIYRIDLKRNSRDNDYISDDNSSHSDRWQNWINHFHTNLLKNSSSSKGKNDRIYKEHTVLDENIEGLKSAFFSYDSVNEHEDAKMFYKQVTADDQFLIPDSHTLSSLLFIWSTKNLYVIPTGYARFDILHHVEENFGFKVMSQFRDSIQIRSKATNPFHGIVYEESQKFSSLVPYSHIMTTDSLINKINGCIDKETASNMLGLQTEGKGKIQLIARDYIRVSQKLTFKELQIFIKLIDDNNEIDKLGDRINSVTYLPEHESIIKLARKLLQSKDSYQLYLLSPDDDYDIANEYEVCYSDGESEEISEITFEHIHKYFLKYADNDPTDERLYNFFKETNIKYKNSEDKYTERKLIELLNGEVEIDKSTCSIINGSFIKYPLSVTANIDKEFKIRLEKLGKINQDLYEKIKPTIKLHYEDRVIASICNRCKNAYPLHRIKRMNIEFADILIEEDDKIYIIHAKRGFDHGMRDLQKQIELSIKQYVSFLRGEEKYIEKLYKSITKTVNNSTKDVNKKEDKKENKKENAKKRIARKVYLRVQKERCKKLIENELDGFKAILRKDVTYIALLILDDSQTKISKSRSTVAKLCLDQLIRYCSSENINFQIATLPNIDAAC